MHEGSKRTKEEAGHKDFYFFTSFVPFVPFVVKARAGRVVYADGAGAGV